MIQKRISPDPETGKILLDELWSGVLHEEATETDPFLDQLINSKSVSVRFCLPTQLLDKLVDPKLDTLCLQKQVGSGDDSLWDPRSFAAKVTVPRNLNNQSVLGTSPDPYVNKPLRKTRLEENPRDVKQKEDWILLYQLLEAVQSADSENYTKQQLIEALRSIKKRYSDFTFEYIIPTRLSLEQTEVIIEEFLSEASGGDRGLSVAAAIFETFGTYFRIYGKVNRYVVNASDQATGSAADIECLDFEGNVRLAVEVKERNLTITDVKSGILKVRKVPINELLFNAPGTAAQDDPEIKELISRTWASGTSLYRLSISELIHVGLALTGEEGRRNFLENVGRQLDTYNTQPSNRKRWKELLEQL